ncbi:MAG: hypothetical protein Q6373_009250 [Candidatus Sigynarchaeota archaeon]
MKNRTFTLVYIAFFALLLTATPGTNFLLDSGIATSAGGDKNINWDPSIARSFITTRIEKQASQASDLDNFDIETPSYVEYTNMTLENIEIKPFIHDYESDITTSQMANGFWVTEFYQEIKVPTSCYIPWIAIQTQFGNVGSNADNWTISLYSSIQESPSPLAKPDKEIAGTAVTMNPGDNRFPYNNVNYNKLHWENITMPNVLLDVSNAYSPDGISFSFFVCARIPALSGAHHHWYCKNDTETGSTDDAGRAFQYVYVPLVGALSELPGIDFTLVAKLVPANAHPNPSDIALKVNGEPVIDTGAAKGIYITNERFTAVNGKVSYAISSRWSNFGPGSLRYDLSADCIQGTEVYPSLKAVVQDAGSLVNWTLDYNISFVQTSGFKTANLTAFLPLSWNSIIFFNVSGGSPSFWPSMTDITPTGKTREFLATGIEPGKWRICGVSNQLAGSASLNLAGGSINLDAVLSGNISVPNGPNGRTTSLRSDYEGGIRSFTALASVANDTFMKRLLLLDNKSIQFSSSSTNNFWSLLSMLKPELQDDVIELGVANEMELFIDPTEGFRAENVQDIEILLDHEPFCKNFWLMNVSALAMQGNTHWNQGGVPLKNYFWFGLGFLGTINVNFTYDNVGKHYSDFYMNFTARIRSNMTNEITRDLVKNIYLDIKTDFPFDTTTHALYIKNQKSGSFVRMNSTWTEKNAQNQSHAVWNSTAEFGSMDIIDFINPTRNTVETFLRVTNTTTLGSTAPSSHVVYMVGSFEYENPFQNLTMVLYNWTKQAFDKQILFSGFTPAKIATRFDLGGSLPTISSYFNANTSSVRITMRGSAIVPLLNSFKWAIDRAMLNVTYIDFVRATWRQTVYKEDGAAVMNQVNTTLFDSPSNNFTTNIKVNKFLDFCDNYTYEMFWHNGTDIMEVEVPFQVNRTSIGLRIMTTLDGSPFRAGDLLDLNARLWYVENETSITGKTILFSFSIEYRSGLHGTEVFAAVTDESGVAACHVKLPDSWRNFYVIARFDSDNPRLRDAVTNPTTKSDVLDLGEYVLHVITQNALTISILAALILTMALVKRKQDQKRRRGWMIDAGKLRDARKIRMLMVIHKDSGGCIFQRAYTQQSLDGDLISGFLTAITDFSKEIGPRGGDALKETDAMYFDYQNFKILIANGNFCRGAIILDGEPTENLKANLKYFIRTFEQKYNMENWRGNVAMFSDADELVEAAFEVSLLQALVAKKMTRQEAEKSIPSGLGKALFQVATSISAEQGYFALSTLAMYAPTSKKISKDQVLAEIYRLKRRGLIVPYRYYT